MRKHGLESYLRQVAALTQALRDDLAQVALQAVLAHRDERGIALVLDHLDALAWERRQLGRAARAVGARARVARAEHVAQPRVERVEVGVAQVERRAPVAPARLDAVDDDVAKVAVAGDLDAERGREAAAR